MTAWGRLFRVKMGVEWGGGMGGGCLKGMEEVSKSPNESRLAGGVGGETGDQVNLITAGFLKALVAGERQRQRGLN